VEDSSHDFENVTETVYVLRTKFGLEEAERMVSQPDFGRTGVHVKLGAAFVRPAARRRFNVDTGVARLIQEL
jgi:hypothetical protein